MFRFFFGSNSAEANSTEANPTEANPADANSADANPTEANSTEAPPPSLIQTIGTTTSSIINSVDAVTTSLRPAFDVTCKSIGEASNAVANQACDLQIALKPVVQNVANNLVDGAAATHDFVQENPGWTLTGVVATLVVIAAAFNSSSASNTINGVQVLPKSKDKW
jgi:hypothetical protein